MSRFFRKSYGSSRFPRWFCSTSQDESTLVTESPVFAKVIAFERRETIVDVRSWMRVLDSRVMHNMSARWRELLKLLRQLGKENLEVRHRREERRDNSGKRERERKWKIKIVWESWEGRQTEGWETRKSPRSLEDGCRTRADYWDLTIDLTYGNPSSIYSD